MNKQRGVTLLELMIVVVVIGILAAIAYPSYTMQVQKTRRAECQGGLMELQNAMERYFTASNTYTGAVTGAGGVFTNQCPTDGGTAVYDLSVAVGLTGTTYTLTAAPTAGGPQVTDICGTMTVTNTGQKTPIGGQCWK